MATTNPTASFQRYLELNFKVPNEIRHDIIYCQRALKAHIKVHQMVLDVYKSQANPDPVQKRRIVDELETQIYEINAEQHYLLLRLRRLIDEFYKSLNRKGVPVMPDIMNDFVSNEVVPYINQASFLVYPIKVRLRSTEDQLIEKYFEVKNEKNETSANNCYEILDSDEEAARDAEKITTPPKVKQQQKQNKEHSQQAALQNGAGSDQKSLLKPISQRVTQREPRTSTPYIDATKFLQVNEEKPASCPKACTTIANYQQKPEPNLEGKRFAEELIVSRRVTWCRLNLRKALKKAHHAIGAYGPAATFTDAVEAPINSTSATSSAVEVVPPVKKYEGRGRPPRNCNAATNLPAMATVKPIEVNSSSDDSTPERNLTPQQATSSFPSGKFDARVQPEELGQEMFLRMFGLYTRAMHVQMQQRRSKRKRRNVQNNEHSDYHYGRIEYGSYPPPEAKKRRKDFLLSPRVKQRLQAKGPKRRSAEKSDETTSTSRSGSSSPDEKRGCNECLKIGGSLEKCKGCKSFYHAACHRENASATSNRIEKVKFCPSCKSEQQRGVKNETLQSTAKQLEEQMVAQKNRRTSLQQESEMYKTQMSTLYNIVKAIKSDQENSSD